MGSACPAALAAGQQVVDIEDRFHAASEAEVDAIVEEEGRLLTALADALEACPR